MQFEFSCKDYIFNIIPNIYTMYMQEDIIYILYITNL